MIPSSSALPRLLARASALALLLIVSAAAPALSRPAGDLAPSAAEVEPGDTLEALLRDLGFDGELLGEIVLGFSSEFDPRKLQPGDRIEVVWSARAPGQARQVILFLGNGESIELDVAGAYRVARHEQETSRAERAVSLTLEDSLVGTIEDAGVPARLGLDLAASLAGLVDLRRDVAGGEPVEILYAEEVLPDGGTIGSPELRYARVEIGGRTLEVAPDGGGTTMMVFEDGELVRRSAAPVVGARISSVFGRRKHPIYGTVRMHTGVDYAAARGTPVFASAPGTVSFVGRRGGYGRVVEIRHDADTMTRYAHLSGPVQGLETGDRVEAGDRIGAVGATGLATGPNLHYEVRYAGRAVDPLADEPVAALAGLDTPGQVEQMLPELRKALADGLRTEPEADQAPNRRRRDV